MSACLLATTMGVNSAEKSLDTTAFVAIWMVAVEVENNVGVSSLTIDGSVLGKQSQSSNYSTEWSDSWIAPINGPQAFSANRPAQCLKSYGKSKMCLTCWK